MWFHEEGRALDEAALRGMMERLVEEAKERIGPNIRRALLLPPDITRYHSGAGALTNMLYHIIGDACRTDVIPTLGQHVPHTPEENSWMFGDIPDDRFRAHHWRDSCINLGEVSAEYVCDSTQGRADWPIPVEVNRSVVAGDNDLIVNIGQVVPHEVLGFANHNKNYFIGLGSKRTICASHMMAALCGIENNLGQIVTPLRGCFNTAERRYLGGLPHVYVLIVKTHDDEGRLQTTGLYVGDDLTTYMSAARYSRERTVHVLEEPVHKMVCYMDEREFRSTWVANKAIYRTRMAIADGGELVVIAPGVERFGEQREVDALIRKYGYRGTPRTIEAYEGDTELRDLGHAAAHLIHGSSEGRFTVTYAPGKLSRAEIEGVGYRYLDPGEALRTYPPHALCQGLNSVDGETVYFTGSPSLGLWAARDKFVGSLKENRSFVGRMAERYPDDPVWPQVKGWDDEDLSRYGV